MNAVTRGIIFTLFFITLFMLDRDLHAQEEEPDEIESLETVEIEDVTSEWWQNERAYAVLDRAINVMTARTMRMNSFIIIIDHRFRQPVSEEPFHDLLGFDAGGLKVGLGLRYGIYYNLDAGIYRLNGTGEAFDVYEFDAKYRPLRQEKHAFDLALRAGVTWFSQQDLEDATGFFGQLLMNRLFAHRLNIGSGLLYHSESSNEVKSTEDDDFSVAIPAYVEFRISGRFMVNVEAVHSIAGYGSSRPVFSTGIKILTNRHTFAIMVTNTRYISADGIVANSPNGLDDLALGFYITRELNL
ncbi:MAG TPA: hypothetical protein ENO22_06955 [candidate division Zixibacteria bacterium]|nr:hypothetical protein [candidate division Zixibacteria bacterium]HEQ99062.1 hypothetical protein [candidate division Zixibacteria bacterium]